jgi:hypothetical protein
VWWQLSNLIRPLIDYCAHIWQLLKELVQGDTVFELKNYHEPSMVCYCERICSTLRTAEILTTC